MKMKTRKKIPWKLYGRCEDCGVDPKASCRTPDDDVADDVCKGRPLIADLPPRARDVSSAAAPKATAHSMPSGTVPHDDALDDIAALLAGPPPDGLRAALNRLADIAGIVGKTGRGPKETSC